MRSRSDGLGVQRPAMIASARRSSKLDFSASCRALRPCSSQSCATVLAFDGMAPSREQDTTPDCRLSAPEREGPLDPRLVALTVFYPDRQLALRQLRDRFRK